MGRKFWQRGRNEDASNATPLPTDTVLRQAVPVVDVWSPPKPKHAPDALDDFRDEVDRIRTGRWRP